MQYIKGKKLIIFKNLLLHTKTFYWEQGEKLMDTNQNCTNQKQRIKFPIYLEFSSYYLSICKSEGTEEPLTTNSVMSTVHP